MTNPLIKIMQQMNPEEDQPKDAMEILHKERQQTVRDLENLEVELDKLMFAYHAKIVQCFKMNGVPQNVIDAYTEMGSSCSSMIDKIHALVSALADHWVGDDDDD